MVRPSVGILVTVFECAVVVPELEISEACDELPTKRILEVAVPVLHVKVTLEDVKVDPGGGVSITDAPVGGGVGVGVGAGVAVGVGVGVAVPPGVGVGVGPPEPTVRIPMPVAVWPSGLLMVTFCEPADAAVVFKSKVTCVGSTYVTEFTVTPPVTVAPMRLANPEPGSKNPEPDTELPVIVTVAEDWPAATLELADDGIAGGGAISFATSKP